MKLKCFITHDEIMHVLMHHPLSQTPIMEGTLNWQGDPTMSYSIWDLYNGYYLVYVKRGSEDVGAVFHDEGDRIFPDTLWSLIWQLEVVLISD